MSLLGLSLLLGVAALGCSDGRKASGLTDRMGNQTPEPGLDGGASGPDAFSIADANEQVPGDASTTGDARTALGPLIPAECAAPSSTGPTSETVRFRLTNPGGGTVFVRSDCGLIEFGVSSCASQYRDQLWEVRPCPVCECATRASCGATCGACAEPAAVAVGSEPVLGTWTATVLEAGEPACVWKRPLPAGRYRVAVKVYPTAEDAAARRGGREVTADFVLATIDEIVDLALSEQPMCDANPSQAVTACKGNEPRDTACDLSEEIEIVTEPPRATDRRETLRLGPGSRVIVASERPGSGEPPVSCTSALPRCSRDSRVVTTGDFARALALPDVQAAFAVQPELYGEFAQTYDGSTFLIRRADGTALRLGPDCRNSTPALCPKPFTPDIRNLWGVVTRMTDQLRADPTCAAFWKSL